VLLILFSLSFYIYRLIISLSFDGLKKICKAFLYLLDFFPIIATLKFYLLRGKLLFPILLIDYTYSNTALKMILLTISFSTYLNFFFIFIGEMQQLLKSASHESYSNCLIDFWNLLDYGFWLMKYLKSILALQLLNECLLIVDSPKLPQIYFFYATLIILAKAV
jgi:hypothetical protein